MQLSLSCHWCVSQMVYKSLEQSDVDVRRELLANIVLTGAWVTDSHDHHKVRACLFCSASNN